MSIDAEPICKNCKALHERWCKTIQERDEKEKELIDLSRKYTRALHTIDILHKHLETQ